MRETAEGKNSEENVWYLAIGSMMLPQSYEQRNFHPLASQPAELLDYKLNFFGGVGFAEAVPAPGESLHGVMHMVTPQQMVELDKLEVGYVRKLGKARPYDGKGENNNDTKELVEVTVYCRPSMDTVNKPPAERYLEILIAGAKHWGVDPTYIQFLQEHEFQPRTLPTDFLSFGDPPPESHYTEVPETTEDGEVYFSLNGKIIHASYPPGHSHGAYLIHMRLYKGPHFEVGLSQLALDLKYGVVKDIKDCSPEHSGYLEDVHYRFMERCDELKYYKVIGSFDSPCP